jgi:hypothetical protein
MDPLSNSFFVKIFIFYEYLPLEVFRTALFVLFFPLNLSARICVCVTRLMHVCLAQDRYHIAEEQVRERLPPCQYMCLSFNVWHIKAKCSLHTSARSFFTAFFGMMSIQAIAENFHSYEHFLAHLFPFKDTHTHTHTHTHIRISPRFWALDKPH